jgi:ribosomal protein S18 acetylase RimI-like enzyme
MLHIRALEQKDLPAVHNFTDKHIGAGYYTLGELQLIFERSCKDGVMYTLLLENNNSEIQGIRITYPPGKWQKGKGQGLHSERWPHALAETAYFQSLFLSDELRGQGWGGKLSLEALRLLMENGAKGVVTHSWKESPENSSTRYLQKLGFEMIAEHPHYWKDVNYNCAGCQKRPCQCTAIEMYLDLEKAL